MKTYKGSSASFSKEGICLLSIPYFNKQRFEEGLSKSKEIKYSEFVKKVSSPYVIINKSFSFMYDHSTKVIMAHDKKNKIYYFYY